MNETKKLSTVWLTESAVMLAFATVLSMLKLVDLPYGGSVTACSMVPIMLVAYRYGALRGLATGLVYGAIQLILGSNNLSYATTWKAAIAIILLDYIVAFAVLGLAGVFRKAFHNRQMPALMCGTVLACLIRYIMHVISGCTVWAGVSIPSSDGLVYSLIYNATYMIPETLVTIIGIWYLTRMVNFNSVKLGGISRPENKAKGISILNMSVSLLIVAAALVVDIAEVFGALQNAETGEFDITGIASVSWVKVGVVTGVAVIVLIAALIINAKNKEEKSN